MSEPHADAYRELRGRVTNLVQNADADALAAIAPATPEWRVCDVLAHMVGVTDDVSNGRLDGVASNAWTQNQVDQRVDCSVSDLLAEWERTSPAFEEIMAGVPEAVSGQALFDSYTHEHDLRQALGAPGARDSDAAAIAWAWISNARAGANGPAVRIVTEFDEFESGGDGPRTTLRASRFELLRACTGRRTREEMLAYEWDPEPNIELILAADIFTPRTESLNE
jgi:uncharacterized protein (TIGR03083 family)